MKNILIEYTYSSVIKKHIVRARGIDLLGSGIKKVHSEGVSGFNVYKLTKAAFYKVYENYKNVITTY